MTAKLISKYKSIFNQKKTTNLDSKVDRYILRLLQEQFLSQNLDYVNINDLINKKYLKKIWCSHGYFRRRVFYNVGVGNISLEDIKNKQKKLIKHSLKRKKINLSKLIRRTNNWYKIDTSLYYKHFLYVKITKQWINKLEKMEKDANKPFYKWFFFKFKRFSEYFLTTKKMLITVFSVFSSIFVLSNFELQYDNFLASILSQKTVQQFHFDPHWNQEYYVKHFLMNEDAWWEVFHSLDNISKIEFRQVSKDSKIIRAHHINWRTYYFEVIQSNWKINFINITQIFDD